MSGGRRRFHAIGLSILGVTLLSRVPMAAAHPGVHHDIDRVSDSIKKDPSRAQLFIERGVYYRIAGDFSASLADFDKAEQLEPANLDIAAHRGITFSSMGRFQDADRELTRFLNSGRVSAAVLAARAEARAKLGQPKAAIADLSRALSISPDVELFIERLQLQESAGQIDQAAAGLREGIAASGGAVVLRDRLIELEIRRKNYDAAIAIIDDQLAVTPVRSDWYLRRSEILDMAAKPSEAGKDRLRALDEADRAMSQRPSAIHLMSRARALESLGRLDEAKKDLQAALDQAPHLEGAADMVARLDKVQTNNGMTSNTEIRGRQ